MWNIKRKRISPQKFVEEYKKATIPGEKDRIVE